MIKERIIFTENKDGSIRIECKYYDVKSFGGGSYNAIYDIDPENRDKLERLIGKPSEKNLKELITAEFGERLDINSFEWYLEENCIEYKFFEWIGDSDKTPSID